MPTPRRPPLRHLQIDGERYLQPEKAYKNLTWLNSHGAKPIRILSEFMEPEERFDSAGVKNTILFFGSARSRSSTDHAAAVARAEAVLANAGAPEAERAKATVMLERLGKTAWMCSVYDKVVALSAKLTEWSMGRIGEDGRIPYIISTGTCAGWAVGRTISALFFPPAPQPHMYCRRRAWIDGGRQQGCGVGAGRRHGRHCH